jgi:hypothetical protein
MGWVVNATLRPSYPRVRPSAHCIGGWMSPRTGLDRCGNSRATSGFDPRTVQPVARRYTDHAISAHYPASVPFVSSANSLIYYNRYVK